MSDETRHTPVADQVVKIKAESLRPRLNLLGVTEELGQDDLLIVRVGIKTDPKDSWKQVMRSGAVVWAAPVLKDELDEEHFPTGEVTVRFDKPPTGRALSTFASSNGLELRDRNEFVAEQAAFRVRDPKQTYLPDLIERLTHKRGVTRAWANTRSRYRRG